MAGKSYAQVMDMNAKASHRGKKSLRSIEVERSANGGFIARHRFNNEGPHYHEPEEHTFGKDEGKKFMAHMAEHMGVNEAGTDKDEQ